MGVSGLIVNGIGRPFSGSAEQHPASRPASTGLNDPGDGRRSEVLQGLGEAEGAEPVAAQPVRKHLGDRGRLSRLGETDANTGEQERRQQQRSAVRPDGEDEVAGGVCDSTQGEDQSRGSLV